MKKLVSGMIFLICILICGIAQAEMRIVATDFVCYDFARAVCGSDADISMLIRPGSEVHTYDPTPSDIISIAECDMFIYIGGESDAWADDILDSFEGTGPKVVRLMDCVEALEEETTQEMTVHEAEEEETEYDEHIWTSPKNAIRMIEMIVTAAEEFGDFSADNYIEEIRSIDEQITDIAANAARKTLLVADRFPYLYFVKEYGLEYKAAFPSCNVESDASARTVAALIDSVRELQTPVIYIVELSSGRIAKTIAEETGAKIRTLYSMQTISKEDFEANETYVSLMRRNLDVLKEGLM